MASGRFPFSSTTRTLLRPCAHLLGIGGVVIASAATLTFIDPANWHRLFPWDASRLDQVSTAAAGAALVAAGGLLLGLSRNFTGKGGTKR